MPYKDLATQRAAHKRWYYENREKRLVSLKAWRDANPERMKELNSRWRKEHPEKMKEYKAVYEARHPERVKAAYLAKKASETPAQVAHRNVVRRKHLAENREEIRAKERAAYWANPTARMASRLRCRLRDALKEGYRAGSAVKNLGCTLDELRKHLESLWLKGMSWQNYKQFGWHIDHKIPLSSFNLEDPEQLKTACHYTNLQPLWWRDNLSKQDK